MMKKLLVGALCLMMAIVPTGCTMGGEAAQEPSESVEVGELTLIGRASVKIDLKNGKRIYIDPFAGEGSDYSEPADLVLVTHQHGDHNKVDLVTMAEGGEVIQCPNDIKAGESIETQGIEIIAVPGYNENHPKEVNCGFVIKVDGVTIYHSGDTSMIEEMGELTAYNIDYAMICMDDYYNMGPEEAMEVAEVVQPRVVIPIHSSPQGMFDQEVVDRFSYEETIVLEPGASTVLMGEAN